MSYHYNRDSTRGRGQGQGQGQYQYQYQNSNQNHPSQYEQDPYGAPQLNGSNAPYPPPLDASLSNWANGGGGGGGYGGYGQSPGGPVQQAHTQARPGAQYTAHTAQSPRAASYGAYPYQQDYQPHSDPPPQPSYNPQEYARPSSQYNPQAYGTSYSAGHQTYNPADYASPTSQSPHASSHLTYGHPSGAHPSPPGAYPSPNMSTGAYGQASPPSHPPPAPPQQRYDLPASVPDPNVQYQNQNQNHYSPATSSSYSQATFSHSAYPVPTSYDPQDDPYPNHAWSAPDPSRAPLPAAQHSYSNISPSALPGLPPDELNLPTPPMHSMNNYNPYEHLHEQPSVSPLNSQYSQVPSPPGPPPPAHAPQRSSTLRHPQLRPLPGPPEPDLEADYFLQRSEPELRDSYATEEEAHDDLFNQVESAVLNAGRASTLLRQTSPRVQLNDSYDAVDQPAPLFSPRVGSGSDRRNGSFANDRLSPDPPTAASIIDDYSDESDAEAAAGLQAMRLAEEEEARGQIGRGNSLLSVHGSQRQPRAPQEKIDEDFSGVDMSAVSGGYDAHMTYGGDSNTLAAGNGPNGVDAYSQPPSASNSHRRSHASSNPGSLYDYTSSNRYGYAPTARVDAGGTGGLSEPSALGRRQSYDEGDEYHLTEDTALPGEPPDLFFHPQPSPHRPLPPPPAASDGDVPRLDTHWRSNSSGAVSQPGYPVRPDGLVQSTTDPDVWVPRSASLISHSSTAQVVHPVRSKTDAEEKRRQGYRGAVYSTFQTTPSASAVAINAIDLPSLQPKRFVPSKLGAAAFEKCEEPWALSSILRWLLHVANPEKMTELRESMIKEALVALFTNKVPTMNIADAETLSNRVVENMYAAGTLANQEEWVKLRPGELSGVIFQLTLSGCYSPRVHSHIIPGRCYSHNCQRTLKKVNLQANTSRATEDWATYYKIKKEDVEGIDKKEIELQNILHEVVQSEENYMDNLDVLVKLYRDPLSTANPPIISPKRQEKFIRDVFGKLDGIKKANVDHLLPQLKYRQQEQGPWIKGFSDIFRQWIRKARVAYIDYAAAFPGATLLLRQELERNINFSNFVDKARSNKLSNKLGWDNYLKAPITRLQRYTLLLQTIHKTMKQESEEKSHLQTAIEEIKAVTLECDGRVAEMQRKVDLADLGQKLVLRPGMSSEVELNLNYHELIFRGDLQRAGGTRFNWLDCHALLFDHYLVLAKAVSVLQKNTGGKVEKYDVSRLPIPMDLLVLENTVEDAVVKSSYVRGITSITPISSRAPASPDPNRLGRLNSNQSPGPLAHVNSGSSMTTLSTINSASGKMSSTTVLDGPKDSEKILYPFRIKHLGNKEPYTLFSLSPGNRTDWCTKIIEAKTKHAASLFAQNAEPFRVKVMADSAFYYDSYSNADRKDSLGVSGGGKPVVIKGTPTDRAIKEVEHRFRDTGRPGPICRARVNCATSFTTPYPGKHMVAVGTDYGVYVSEIDNPRGWSRALTIPRVTQMAVLEEFNLFLLLADKSLIAYHLDAVCSPDRVATGTSSADAGPARKAPQKLSGSRDVGFFAVGRMKDRTLVFYKKRDGVSSTFKVLEPVFQKSTEKKRGIFKRGTTEFFRDYDDFYVGTECTGINLFQSSLSVSTDKGFEVLTLDKKQSWSVPDWRAPEVANIATHVDKQATLGMLRLNEQEFLLCYEKCAVYVNKHGEVCRSVVMNFVARAKSAALYGAYLLLFDTEFVEIRNAQNGRLKQIISGRDIKCLDDGGGGTLSGGSTNTGVVNGVPGYGAASRSVKVVMQHPDLERTQIVVELVLNGDLKET